MERSFGKQRTESYHQNSKAMKIREKIAKGLDCKIDPCSIYGERVITNVIKCTTSKACGYIKDVLEFVVP